MNFAQAQTWGQTHSIQVNATADAANTEIDLSWNIYATVTSVEVYRRTTGSWPGTPLATLGASATSYTDATVSANTLYEYKIVGTSATSYDAFGYVKSGIEMDETTNRGLLIMIIDDQLVDSLASELETYEKDLRGDGFDIIVKEFDTSLSAGALNDTIADLYSRHGDLTSVFLVGSMPYYYTGAMSPDGHANHHGAWPSDVMYADVNGTYSDAVINYTNTTDSRHTNSTSDTKSDQSYLATNAEIQIGRLDLGDLPTFSGAVADLYRNYFAKLHSFKTGEFKPREIGIVDDNFTGYAEGFSQNGYRNYSPLTSIDSVFNADILTTTGNSSALWSFACGGGSFTSINGFATSNQLSNRNLNGVFALVMGSYNADPDKSNNLMRSMLANGNFLTSGWAGRPNWFIHGMGMGETIGEATLTTQNNTSTAYEPTGFYATMMHVMLHGDPSLKNHYTSNVTNLNTIRCYSKDTAFLNWTEANNSLGYNIYRSKDEFTGYAKINTSLIDTNYYEDLISSDTSYYYRIETYELVENNSGSFYESSVGAYILSDKDANPLPVTLISFTAEQVDKEVELSWTVADEIDFSHYEIEKYDDQTLEWINIGEMAAQGQMNDLTTYHFTDINPLIGKNIYRLKMVDYDASFEYSPMRVVLFSNELGLGEFTISPTLASENITVYSEETNNNMEQEFFITDANGSVVNRILLNEFNTKIDVSSLNSGVYFIASSNGQGSAQRFIKL
ncbi:MAG: T9SS type A sorting domain-containing protein [Bacteroidia bacterium]